MKVSVRLLFASVAVVGSSVLASAHFILVAPASWVVENRLGDPQKLGPCGGTSADPGTPTHTVSEVRGGDTLHLKLQETIFHPGHYRVALAVNSRAELPPDPEVTTRDTERGPWSVSSPIQDPVQAPLLADGLFVHTAKPADPFETDIQIPNLSCAKCTLQIVQFMAEHGLNKDGGYFYHHCADLKITADPAKPIDTRWAARR